MSSEQIIEIVSVVGGNGATFSAIESMIHQEASQPITWFIDRVGDRNINHYSINSLASAALMSMNDLSYPVNYNRTLINNLRTSLSENIDINIPTIPFENDDDWLDNLLYDDPPPLVEENGLPPLVDLVEIVIDTDMEITEEQKDCCVCQEDRDDTSDICRLNCAHTFCGDCVKNLMISQRKCPLCRAQISKISVQNEENFRKI